MNHHGTFSFYWEDDLFNVKAFGPFNEEGFIYGVEQLKESVLNHGCKKWRRLEIWDYEALGSPKVLKHGKAAFDWCENNGCMAAAVVVSNLLQEVAIRTLAPGMVEIFRDVDKAKEWIDQQQ